ncbi:hypothetical protein halTADL_0116 [Halohasta litchfieldiae]|jgi:hypothetical protein|uniref:Uncharacterized protein n=1 Tax=Halohasta litchfieldiae TaxID=1073996 RepID=A0A1H6SSE4_9EURY|nr:hypothetical protein [Halohasta litchfieldiae]ATW86938.1 hypothetical protein halTADL_0116 [Halohasta litchfieldiae]SEI70813.1 hypothetical protein SAMN05444271_10647 [Halohasta litchfieldiae]
MSTTHDEVAGVVDLFGALTRSELTRALDELAFKQGEAVNEAALESAIETATDAYALVEYEPATTGEDSTTETLLTVGPTAFPTLPSNAEDLPHILDYERRSVDRQRLATQVRERLTAEAEAAVDADDTDRAGELMDVSYDIEVWATVEAGEVRSTLEPLLPQD